MTQAGGPVVSLTTFGKRTDTVHLAIESIGRGRALPSRIILWIDDQGRFDSPPQAIRRLQRRGLEIKLCTNYGPHTKYYPYVASEEAFPTALVTADDDVLYPRYWLQKLVEALREYPETVNCYWAHVISVRAEGISEYANWKLCGSTSPSVRHLATCVYGVIYPPAFLSLIHIYTTS